MSDQTKKDAQNTEYSLRSAEVYINEAERYAKGTGDKKLVEKVTKIRKDVVETRKELSEKLNNG